MKTFWRLIGTGAFLAVLITMVIALAKARAMPYFSRKYRTSCTTCHEAFPRRNAVGEAFRMRGYRFVDDEAYRKKQPVELGDESYKRLWPNAIWPSDIPEQIPLSLVGRFLAEFDLDGSRDDTVMLLFPEELELVFADAMGDDISFYADMIYISKDFGGNEVESWITVKAWLQYQSLFGPENMLNVKVGTVGIHGLSLYTARDANNFSTHFYQYSTWSMPKVKLAQSGLNDFDGNPFSLQPLVGLELNGVGRRWAYTTGLVNGDVKNPVNEFPEDDIYFVGIAEGTPSDAFFQGVYKIGGMPLDGSNAVDESPLTARPEFWRDDNLTFSIFGYLGSADVETEDAAGVRRRREDDYWRLGSSVLAKYSDLMVGAGIMYGDNDNPYGDLSSESVDSLAWFAEGYYFVYPWLIPYVRYEGLKLDLPSDVAGLDSDQDRARVILGSKGMIRANIALNVEVTTYTDGSKVEEGIDNTLFVLLSAAF
jgi:hypothetical protein